MALQTGTTGKECDDLCLVPLSKGHVGPDRNDQRLVFRQIVTRKNLTDGPSQTNDRAESGV